MKNFYLVLTFLIFTCQTFGQALKKQGATAIKCSTPAPVQKSSALPADEVIWGDNPGEGDFDGGLNNWTIEAVSDTTGLWYWDEDATVVGGFFDQTTLASATAANGVMAFNADYETTTGDPDNLPDPPYPVHVGDLISPTIDLTNAVDPQVLFTQAFRGFTGDGGLTERGALFAYSTDDGATWSDFQAINDNLGLREYSDNPEFKRVEITETAGGSTVKIKFRFSGNFYFWMIDDVKIVERPAHNTRISDFGVAVAEYYVAPTTQSYPVYFGGYVSNIGGENQSNVTLSAKIDRYDLMGNLVADDDYSGSTSIDVLESGKADSLVLFPTTESYMLPGEGGYFLDYEVTQDSADADANNNTYATEFSLYDGYYSKAVLNTNFEPLRTAAYRPSDVTSYEYGVHMYVPNGDEISAEGVQFSYASNGALEGVDITILLYEWVDGNEDVQITSDELEIVGFNTFTYTDEASYDVVTVKLLDAMTNAEGVRLKDDTHYILAGQYSGQDDIFMAVDESIEYDPSIVASYERFIETGDAKMIRYADVLYTGGEDWGQLGFNIVGGPSIVMITDDVVAIEDANGVPVEVSTYPNPVNDILNVNVSTEAISKDWQVTISDVSGRNILLNRTAQQADFPLQINTANYAKGVYLLTLENNGQIHTERFVKR